MDIKLELLSGFICDTIKENLDTLNIDPSEIADIRATKILGEIKDVICDENLDDFDVVDKIVDIFTKNQIDVGSRHDF